MTNQNNAAAAAAINAAATIDPNKPLTAGQMIALLTENNRQQMIAMQQMSNNRSSKGRKQRQTIESSTEPLPQVRVIPGVTFVFTDKPSTAVRNSMKDCGMSWEPNSGTWNGPDTKEVRALAATLGAK